ncbi:MAG: DUF362 domain-containing protein [Deltaproteobacteria bacterium]|jgi:uncharacterized protein (DUF362 family)
MKGSGITRRKFLKYSGITAGAVMLGFKGGASMGTNKSPVVFFETESHKAGAASCMRAFGTNLIKNKEVLIKPNFNTSDSFPGSTHNETLVSLVDEVWNLGGKSVAVGERSYPPTKQVMEEKGIIPLLDKRDVRILNFDDLPDKDWVKFNPKGSHWREGFRVARPILEAECLISTCCLKTHRYGGVFTMSLKLHVGVVPTDRHGYGYMRELHSSPNQRKMIAEINAPFKPDLIVLDGVEAFVDGGPMTGKRAKARVFLASSDRVAADAVALAVLKVLGSNKQIMSTKIYEQEQISRAVQLGLGASSPSEIDLVPGDEESTEYCSRVGEVLAQG